MKKDRTDFPDSKKTLKRLNQESEKTQDRQNNIELLRQKGPSNLGQRVFEELDWLSRHINNSQTKAIEESKTSEIGELLHEVGQKMTVDEMHNLEYANRLHYIHKVLNRRNFKGKNWSLLHEMVST